MQIADTGYSIEHPKEEVKTHSPSVSEGAEAGQLPNEPIAASDPRVSASGPLPAPNEPTNPECIDLPNPAPQLFAPPFRNSEPSPLDSAFSPGNHDPVEKL
jgi:hypothetical protein